MHMPEHIERWPVEKLEPFDKNPRVHSDEQIEKIARSIRKYGWTNPIYVWNGTILAGHARLEAAKRLGLETVPVIRVDYMTFEDAKAYVIADNQLALGSSWDEQALAELVAELDAVQYDLDVLGFPDDELEALLAGERNPAPPKEPLNREASGALAQRFGVPPFSVLDARKGWWRERKRSWLALGIRSELGRGEALLFDPDTSDSPAHRAITTTSDATSVFDPVLCELAYRWFCPAGGTVLDPFAGGSVRGVVASRLGRQYVGVELRPEQVEANRAQADELCGDPVPVWINGDSRQIPVLVGGDLEADFVFSCPPYFDLEVYSEDERDLSRARPEEFADAYREIVAHCVAKLRRDRFAAFVVGDVRGRDGSYLGLPQLTIEAFEAAGTKLWNDAVYVPPAGSLPLRAGRQFAATRKLGRAHQYLLVFCKGDGRKAAEAAGECEFGEPEENEEEVTEE